MPKQFIDVFPKADMWKALRPARPMKPWLSQFISLHPLGRAALYWAFVGLRPQPGSVAWMPAYHCGVEVQAAIEAGYDVRFYAVNPDLSIDEADLLAKVSRNPGPILLAHYFGFPQACVEHLARVCAEQGWPLIEDCAHALFSSDGKRPLGEYAPISVYSLYKVLPVNEGGVLRIDRAAMPELAGFQPSLAPRSASTYAKYARAELARLFGSARMERLRNAARRETETTSGTGTLEFGAFRDQALFPLSRRLANMAEPEEIVEKRRRNYGRLDSLLAQHVGYSRLFERLTPGISPLCLPICVSRRAELMRQLYRNDVRAYVIGVSPHPQTPPEAVSQTRWVRDSILTLPVHQELRASEIEHIARVLGPRLREHTPDLHPPDLHSPDLPTKSMTSTA